MWQFSAAVILSFLSALIFAKTMEQEKNKDSKELKSFLVSFVFYLVTDIPMAFLFARIFSAADTAGTIFFLNIMFLIAIKDIKQRIIPNVLVVVLALAKLITVIISGISQGNFKERIIVMAAGAAGGLVITGIAAVLPGKGMGAGDVKMYAAIGAFAGIAGVMDILIYTCLLCAAAGIVLMAAGKCSFRSFVPMAPFAYAGTLIYMIAGCAAL